VAPHDVQNRKGMIKPAARKAERVNQWGGDICECFLKIHGVLFRDVVQQVCKCGACGVTNTVEITNNSGWYNAVSQ